MVRQVYSISYFLKTANNGSINAFHHLAMLYQQDSYRNYYKAFRYASSSAANGIAEGEFILANLLYIGRGCEADTNKAYKYYKRTLAHGMEQAAFIIKRIEQDL